MSRIIFETKAMDDMNKWAVENPKILKRIVELLNNMRNEPFTGLGKPEPLKHQYRGYWSRRITDEHRLIYKVDPEKNIIVYSLINHYPQD